MAVEARRSKTRCLALILAGIIVQILIIVLFFVLIFRVRTPKVRLGSVSVQHLRVNSNSSERPFNMKLAAQVTVKNTNFGRYKFEETKAVVSYRGNEVGVVDIAKGRAKARHTQKFNVTISLNSNKVSSDSHLRSDLKSKSLTLTAHAKLTGKIHVLKIFRRRRSTQMNCTFVVNTSSKTVKDLTCH